jgi:glycosyltransferase involved in cell wall biosynthesis
MTNNTRNIQLYKIPCEDIELFNKTLPGLRKMISFKHLKQPTLQKAKISSEILVISSYPPRICGIATYSKDLISVMNKKFSNSFECKVCALESGLANFKYPDEVKYILDTSKEHDYHELAIKINMDCLISTVLIQHEFGFFAKQKNAFIDFVNAIKRPVIISFHTVLPHPDKKLKNEISQVVSGCESVIVMTQNSADILEQEYKISPKKINVIAHGTHLVQHLSEKFLKKKYGLTGRKVLATFGLLSSGKSIETTLNALPEIVKLFPEVVFLVLGKTHPEVVKNEGEQYREMLEQKVTDLSLQEHVKFINTYLPTTDLLEYLQLTDIYLFTSKDPNQAVSGTFVYAMSCACPIISTPIPHAKEVLSKDTGIIFDFCDSKQLAQAVISLLNNEPLRKNMIANTLQKIVSTSWENSAVEHAVLINARSDQKTPLQYNLPEINLSHFKKMTTKTGLIQFSKINQPDITSGYTLDDNARALVVSGMYLKLTGDKEILTHLRIYLNFVKLCQQKDGTFLNYVTKSREFSEQNQTVNLDDANGRAIWALGYIISIRELLPENITVVAMKIINKALPAMTKMSSTRAVAFIIKGLHYYLKTIDSAKYLELFITLSNRLVQMYKHESNEKWQWFEDYLTYANSVMPEAMLYAWSLTNEPEYRKIAISTLDFLLSKTFNENGIEVISNNQWLLKGNTAEKYGEQPIDVAYTILTLNEFYDKLDDQQYLNKMTIAFNWFLGDNRLHQIVYNPCTGGCYDGIEKTHVNLNQGAESLVSYLMARMTMSFRNQ